MIRVDGVEDLQTSTPYVQIIKTHKRIVMFRVDGVNDSQTSPPGPNYKDQKKDCYL